MLAKLPAKAIYLANRHPRMTREQFAHRWRHHALAAGTIDPRSAEIAGMRYCLAVPPGGILPSATDEHDGVALLALRGLGSIPAFHSLLNDNEVAFADELRTFERPVQDFTLLTLSELVVDGPETEAVVIQLGRRRPELRPIEFADRLAAGAEGDLDDAGLTPAVLRRWVRNTLVAPAPRGFNYDVVNELWFDSVSAIAESSAAVERFLARSHDRIDPGRSLVVVARVIDRRGRDRP